MFTALVWLGGAAGLLFAWRFALEKYKEKHRDSRLVTVKYSDDLPQADAIRRYNRTIIVAVSQLLISAIREGAKEIVIEVAKHHGISKVRIGDTWHNRESYSKDDGQSIAFHMLEIGGRAYDRRNEPDGGRNQVNIDGQMYHLTGKYEDVNGSEKVTVKISAGESHDSF